MKIIVNDCRPRRGNTTRQKEQRPAENVLGCSTSLAIDAVAGTNYDSFGDDLAFEDVAAIINAHSGAAGNGDGGFKLKLK